MPSKNTIDFKRGDTFSEAAFLPEGALYADGTWIAKCEAVERLTLQRRTLKATLTPPVAPETRYFLTLFAPASQTAAWNPGKLECDVEFIDTAAMPEPFKASTMTFTIVVGKDVTQ